MASFEDRSHFNASEFDQPDEMSDHLISLLDMARAAAGVPFVITSSFRERTVGKSAHEYGLAVDIDIMPLDESRQRKLIVAALLAAGFTRIGIYYSDNAGHVHADIGDTVDPDKWRPDHMWVKKSRPLA